MARIISLIRYRFFLFAGFFPYLLGQVIAFNLKKNLNWQNFWLGILGIFLVLVGVELFNEYFDAKEGGDRIFLKERPKIPHHFFLFALCSMLSAFIIGLYLTFKIGWPILIFSFLGFLAAFFYMGPPIRWAYLGLGEIVIALSYGPLMLLGSYYLQVQRIDSVPFIVSIILGLSIFSLAIVNEIPDYIQDKLVGKKNMVVRFGRKNAFKIFILSLFCVFFMLCLGVWLNKIPCVSLLIFLVSPLIVNKIEEVKEKLEIPKAFYPIVKMAIFVYMLVVSSLGVGYLLGVK